MAGRQDRAWAGSLVHDRAWYLRPKDEAPLRRIHAKMSDAKQFGELESHCHNFVRRGQALRASGSPQGT